MGIFRIFAIAAGRDASLSGSYTTASAASTGKKAPSDRKIASVSASNAFVVFMVWFLLDNLVLVVVFAVLSCVFMVFSS